MKNKIFALILVILNVLALFSLPTVCETEEPTFENNGMFLRLHVRADSDGEFAQAVKLKVRDSVLSVTSELLKDCKTKDEAMKIISENTYNIKKTASKTLEENECYLPVSVEIKKERFEYREYDGFFLPEDVYDSLIVSIGSGEGHNWWCVVFPAVCLSGSSAEEKVEKKTDGDSVPASVEVDISAVPEEYRLAKDPVPEKVVYDFWIVRFFKNLFGIK